MNKFINTYCKIRNVPPRVLSEDLIQYLWDIRALDKIVDRIKSKDRISVQVCKKCNEIKDIGMFYFNLNLKTGRSRTCNQCDSNRVKTRYRKKKEAEK